MTTNVRRQIPEQRTSNDRPASWALVERAQAGDREAFGELYRQYHDVVYRYAYHRSSSNARLAEDVTSTVFERALARIDRFTWQGRDIGAWFVTIARHLILDHYKGRWGKFEVSVGDVLDVDQPRGRSWALKLAADDPYAEAEASQLSRDVAVAIGCLKREHREAIQLRYFEGLSTRDAAIKLGIGENALKALLYRAVSALRRGGLLEGYR